MRKSKFFILVSLWLTPFNTPCLDSNVSAQPDAPVEEQSESAAMQRMRERAERVQELRKARVSHAQREAAASRAEAARAQALKQRAPETGENGGAR